MDMLRGLGAILVNQRVVVEDRIITATGISASIDLGLKLIEIMISKELSRQVAEYIEYIESQ